VLTGIPRSDISGRHGGEQAGAAARLRDADAVAHACKLSTGIDSQENSESWQRMREGVAGWLGQVSGGAGSLRRSAAPRLAGQVSGDAGRAVLVSGDAARRAGSGRAADVWAKARPRRRGVGASMSGQICTGTKAGPGLAEGLREVQAVEVTGPNEPAGAGRPGRRRLPGCGRVLSVF
jgi:hypothetical protein